MEIDTGCLYWYCFRSSRWLYDANFDGEGGWVSDDRVYVMRVSLRVNLGVHQGSLDPEAFRKSYQMSRARVKAWRDSPPIPGNAMEYVMGEVRKRDQERFLCFQQFNAWDLYTQFPLPVVEDVACAWIYQSDSSASAELVEPLEEGPLIADLDFWAVAGFDQGSARIRLEQAFATLTDPSVSAFAKEHRLPFHLVRPGLNNDVLRVPDTFTGYVYRVDSGWDLDPEQSYGPDVDSDDG